MKKQLILIMALCFGVAVVAQKKGKIKGDKVVTDVFSSLEDFNAIEIGDNLEVNITQTAENGYHLKADENLVNVVKLDIVNGVLKIYTTLRVTSSKAFEINLTFDNIDQIILNGEAKLTSKNRLEFETLSFAAADDASYELDLKVGNGTFNLTDHSKGDIVLKADKATMILNENAFLEGDFVADDLDLTVNKRADMRLKGDVDNLKLTATGSSDIKANKLRAAYADLNASNSSDIYVNATKELKIYTKGKSFVYVYGNPEIKVDGLNDKSKIIKR